MTDTKPFFHAEQVGSLLRPAPLLKAWSRRDAGDLLDSDLLEMQDAAIAQAIHKQEALGFRTVVDGEFRRDVWWSEFIEPRCIAGITIDRDDPSTWFDKNRSAGDLPTYVPKRIRVTDRIRRTGSIMGHAFEVMTSATGTGAGALPKVTIPTPARFHFQYGYDAVDRAVYPDLDDFWADVTRLYREEIADLEAAGCRSIQIDDPVLSYFVDPGLRAKTAEMGDTPEGLLRQYIEAINAAVADRRPYTCIGFHICRGNARGSWIASGGYEAIAADIFPALDVDVYYLEYDDARSGDFEPLRLIPEGKKVVLGLITTKRPDLEDPDGLKRRIGEAAQIVPLEDLAISPQCGFASVMEGNPVTPADQASKLKLVLDVARDVWGSA